MDNDRTPQELAEQARQEAVRTATAAIEANGKFAEAAARAAVGQQPAPTPAPTTNTGGNAWLIGGLAVAILMVLIAYVWIASGPSRSELQQVDGKATQADKAAAVADAKATAAQTMAGQAMTTAQGASKDATEARIAAEVAKALAGKCAQPCCPQVCPAAQPPVQRRVVPQPPRPRAVAPAPAPRRPPPPPPVSQPEQPPPAADPPAPPASQPGCDENCRRMRLERRRDRREDGRCVLQLKDQTGSDHYVRFEFKRGTNLLLAARVDDKKGEWNHSNQPSFVGRHDQPQTATVANKDCGAAIRLFSEPATFAWTSQRLGLPACRPEGRV